jgi:hypothetical protein
VSHSSCTKHAADVHAHSAPGLPASHTTVLQPVLSPQALKCIAAMHQVRGLRGASQCVACVSRTRGGSPASCQNTPCATRPPQKQHLKLPGRAQHACTRQAVQCWFGKLETSQNPSACHAFLAPACDSHAGSNLPRANQAHGHVSFSAAKPPFPDAANQHCAYRTNARGGESSKHHTDISPHATTKESQAAASVRTGHSTADGQMEGE